MKKLIWSQSFINKIICGDSLSVMKEMPSESIDMVMTSPPYWGLRDYGIEQIFGGDKDCKHEWQEEIRKAKKNNWNEGFNMRWEDSPTYSQKQDKAIKIPEQSQGFCLKCGAWKGQLGLEPTPELYIEHLTEIFNEAKRVLKKEGTLWLNLGDTYFTKAGASSAFKNRPSQADKYVMGNRKFEGLIDKCLCMIPERLAWSLIQDGWILRNKIIWYKPNSMPSSVKDRFSNRWEYIFMFSRSRKYYFDLDAVRERHKYDGRKDTLYKGRPKDMQIGKHERWPNLAGKNPGDVIRTPAETRTLGAILGVKGAIKVPGGKGWVGHPKGGGAACQKDPRWCPPEGPNPGDFLEINTQPFPVAHFAVFPEKLCEKPIKAGCPEQVCKRCGKARERVSKPKFTKHNGKTETKYNKKTTSAGRLALLRQKARESGREYINERIYLGWTFCNCNAGFEPGVVLDPLCGSGTVGVVAKKFGRNFILTDIKKEYCEMADRRISKVGYQMELRI